MKKIKALYLISCREAKFGDRTIPYGEATFYAMPYPVSPTHGEHDYRNCETCLNHHKQIINLLKKKVKKFPNCCESHRKLLTLKDFNRSDYRDAAKQCADKVIFTYQHILNNQSSPLWEIEISKYINEVVDSFGCFPQGYGMPFLLDDYISIVKQLIDNNDNIKQKVIAYVNSEFDKLNIETNRIDPIASLCKIYDDWLNLVPFGLPFLNDLREDFRSRSPLVVYDKPDPDGKVHHFLFSDSKLLDYLSNLTACLLNKVGEKITKIDIPELTEYYNEYVRHKFLFNNHLLVDQHENYPYVEIIKRWMDNQAAFFNDLNKLNEVWCYRDEDAYPNDSYKESLKRIGDFKRYIEYNDVGILINPKYKEHCLQKLFKFIWRVTSFDFNAEVNNGRGSVDFKVSKGFQDKTIIEFKLASNSKLRQNLQNQVEIYKISNDTNKDILVLFFFTEDEKNRLYKIINELQLSNMENVIVIDCRKQKPSASNVMSTVGTGQCHAQRTRITKEVRSDTEQY